jgi:hypothetical protein
MMISGMTEHLNGIEFVSRDVERAVKGAGDQTVGWGAR